MTKIELHSLLILVKDLHHSHSPGVHSGESVNGCLNVDGDVVVNVEKCESSQTRVIADLKGVFILYSPLKDLSAEQLVTGKVQRILTRAVMLGYMELTCLRVSVRLVGKLLSP